MENGYRALLLDFGGPDGLAGRVCTDLKPCQPVLGPARALGMAAVHFTSADSGVAEIAALLGF